VRSILCFGEVLWDCLPAGRQLGGAPFNVAHHLFRLGRPVRLLSAVGRDPLGDEILARMRGRGIDTGGLARHADLPTGTVQVRLDAGGNPRFEIGEPSAWDRIPLPPGGEIGNVCGLVYGTLALRRQFNRRILDRLLNMPGWLKICDLNLRAPHDDLPRAWEAARRADVLKLNRDELIRLLDSNLARRDLPDMLEELSTRLGIDSICVTLGADGAVWLHHGRLHVAPGESVQVRDTVGAGDAFTAVIAAGLTGPVLPDPAVLLGAACRLGAFVAGREGATPDYDPRELGIAVILGA
jgi:fructokinase